MDRRAENLNVLSAIVTSELFLSRGVPDIEHDGSSWGVKDEGMNFNSECGNVLLLELSGHVPGAKDDQIRVVLQSEYSYVLCSQNLDV